MIFIENSLNHQSIVRIKEKKTMAFSNFKSVSQVIEQYPLILKRERFYSFPNSVWECLPRRSASNIHQISLALGVRHSAPKLKLWTPTARYITLIKHEFKLYQHSATLYLLMNPQQSPEVTNYPIDQYSQSLQFFAPHY
jgi:hypothetical protein